MFAYVASHDLQEQLRTVAGLSELLKLRYSGQLDQQANQYIELIVGAATRINALLQDVLKYSRIAREEGSRVASIGKEHRYINLNEIERFGSLDLIDNALQNQDPGYPITRRAGPIFPLPQGARASCAREARFRSVSPRLDLRELIASPIRTETPPDR